ncbi:MAG: hypothetical protein ACLTXH_05500 [Enterobacter hormaechei]
MPINDNTPRPQEFAAVDLGSNSFHMVIAREWMARCRSSVV